MGGPQLVWSGLSGYGDVIQRIVHRAHEALRLRRTLRSKLNGREEVNNGTRGQRHSILPANPVASIRLEELLVRDGRSNPVRKYRGLRVGEPNCVAGGPG